MTTPYILTESQRTAHTRRQSVASRRLDIQARLAQAETTVGIFKPIAERAVEELAATAAEWAAFQEAFPTETPEEVGE